MRGIVTTFGKRRYTSRLQAFERREFIAVCKADAFGTPSHTWSEEDLAAERIAWARVAALRCTRVSRYHHLALGPARATPIIRARR